MAIVVEMHNTGDPATRSEIAAAIEHVLSDRAGDWKVSLMGSQANDRLEMKIQGPNAFERSYTLEGSSRGDYCIVRKDAAAEDSRWKCSSAAAGLISEIGSVRRIK